MFGIDFFSLEAKKRHNHVPEELVEELKRQVALGSEIPGSKKGVKFAGELVSYIDQLEQNLFDMKVMLNATVQHNVTLEQSWHLEKERELNTKHQLERMITFADDWMCLLNDDFEIQVANDSFIAAMGIKKNVVGMPIKKILGEKGFKTQIRHYFVDALEGKEITFSLDVGGGKGTPPKRIKVKLVPYETRPGHVSHLIFKASPDLSSQKLGNEIACKLDDLLKNTHDTVFVLGMDRTILFCNRQIKDVFGWPESHVVGKDFMEFICSDEDRALMGSLVDRIKSSGEWDGELRIRHKDGHDVVVQSHAVLTYQENNNPILLIFNQDISEMRSIENQFFRYQRMENIGLLSSGIVHDLNNILTPIFVSVHALKPKLLDKQSKLIVSLLEASAIRGQQLVKQLLGYAQGKDCGLSRLDLKPIILELEDIVQKTFPKEISFVSDISDDLWHLQGDAVQLHQMLLNLCINARDAMPKGGTLVFSAANKTISNEPFVRLNLVDSGIGMSKELMAKIFDPFFTTKENGKGTGLGLSTVLSIIKKHGGELNVVSDKGKGATFEIYLPAITPE